MEFVMKESSNTIFLLIQVLPTHSSPEHPVTLDHSSPFLLFHPPQLHKFPVTDIFCTFSDRCPDSYL